jgi:methylthioribulose-1-phosphate dehydratase
MTASNISNRRLQRPELRLKKPKRPGFSQLSRALAETGRNFYSRNWVLGTSGNFSAVVDPNPLRLAITASGIDKGNLVPKDILEINDSGEVLRGAGKPSSETLIHLAIVRSLGAGAVLHTHSVWSTLLSQTYAADGGVFLEGHEMLKGLSGVRSHDHREWLPIVKNSQDMPQLSQEIMGVLQQHRDIHGILLKEHGLYTWGPTLLDAKRHIEIFEFLFEARVRLLAIQDRKYREQIG